MDILKRFGRRVRELRIERGWSPEQLAATCGAEPRYVNDIEAGKREVRLLDVDRLARALNVPIADLFVD